MKSIFARAAVIVIAATIPATMPATLLANPQNQKAGIEPTKGQLVVGVPLASEPDMSKLDALRRQGDDFAKNGNIDAALVTYLKAIGTKQASGEIYLKVGDIYFDKNDMQNAMRFYRDALPRTQGEPRTYFMISIVMAKTGLYREAVEVYRVGEQQLHAGYTVAFPKGLRLSPNANGMRRLEAAAHTGVGLTYYFTDQKEGAIKHFNAAAEADPSFGYSSLYHGNLLHFRGQNKEAKKFYEQAMASTDAELVKATKQAMR